MAEKVSNLFSTIFFLCFLSLEHIERSRLFEGLLNALPQDDGLRTVCIVSILVIVVVVAVLLHSILGKLIDRFGGDIKRTAQIQKPSKGKSKKHR